MQGWELVLLIVGLIASMWMAIGFVSARLGPWRRLVARYPVSQWTPVVSKAHFVSLDCGWMSYGNCLVIDFGEDTMTVRMGLAMLPFHPPFMVPKSSIHDVRRGRLLFIDWIRFQVDDCRFLLWGPNTRARFFDSLET